MRRVTTVIEIFKSVLAHAQSRAEADQAELAHEIETRHAGGYDATVEGVDRGLRAAAEGRFSSEEQVDAIFLRHRDT